jgi:hypothetical protein
MTRSGRAVLVVEVEVLADLVEDALDDLVDDRVLFRLLELLESRRGLAVLGQLDCHPVLVLAQPDQLAAAPDLGAELASALGQQALGDRLRDGETVDKLNQVGATRISASPLRAAKDLYVPLFGPTEVPGGGLIIQANDPDGAFFMLIEGGQS